MGRKNTAHILAALALLAVFALAVFSCLVAGAKSYRRISESADFAYTRRTAAAYLHTQLSRAGEVSVEPFGEEAALCLHETLDGTEYTTRIYCHGGWLMELFSRRETVFDPEDGRQVLALESLDITEEGEMLILRFADGHGEQSLHWLRRCSYEE